MGQLQHRSPAMYHVWYDMACCYGYSLAVRLERPLAGNYRNIMYWAWTDCTLLSVDIAAGPARSERKSATSAGHVGSESTTFGMIQGLCCWAPPLVAETHRVEAAGPTTGGVGAAASRATAAAFPEYDNLELRTAAMVERRDNRTSAHALMHANSCTELSGDYNMRSVGGKFRGGAMPCYTTARSVGEVGLGTLGRHYTLWGCCRRLVRHPH